MASRDAVGSAAASYGVHVAAFGELADPARIGELAAQAEAAGFDGFFVWDHIDRPHRGCAVADTTVTLAAIAMATSRIRFGALVTPLSRRRPAKFARETASLDHLSRGRLVVGVGIGVDTGGELARLGEIVDPLTRGDMLDEALEVLTSLWSGESLTYRGEHLLASELTFTPRPAQIPRPPIWIATRRTSGRPVRRAARFDGVVPEIPVGELPALLAEIARLRGGTLKGFDVVAKGPPGTDPEPSIDAGATWWLTALPESVSAREALDIISDGPAIRTTP